MKKIEEEFLPESLSLFKAIKFGHYKFSDLIVDIKAGILLSVLCFPLVMAYASASGLNPEIGLTTAIITGIISFLLGGGRFHVICPTGAFIVIINDIMTHHNYEFLIHSTVLSGLILFLCAYFRLGRFSKYIPVAVLKGFLTGIGVILVVQQIGNVLGINCRGNLFQRLYFYIINYDNCNIASITLGIFLISIFFIIKKFWFKAPTYFIILSLGIFYSLLFPDTLETINTRFHLSTCELKMSSVTLNYNWNNIWQFLPYSIMIAFLAGTEALLGAIMVENNTGLKHKTNVELINVGMTNFITFVFNMMPSSCAISMTSANTENAKSSISLLVNVISIFLLMTVLSKYISKVSMCCFASIVIPFGLGMIDYKSFRKFGRKDKMTFIITTLVTIIYNVIYAVIAGLLYNYISDIFNRKISTKQYKKESLA